LNILPKAKVIRVHRQQETVDRLRRMILTEEIAGGERLLEVQLSQQLEVSRTPIREALITLAEEGLVEYRPNGGYAVRSFSPTDIADAYTVREAIEALACRIIAEQGLSQDVKQSLETCLEEGDVLLSGAKLLRSAREPWGAINHRFHSLIFEAADNRALNDAMRRVTNIPYSSSRVVHWFEEDDPNGLYLLRMVHSQHHAIFKAICGGEGYRAELVMRGHIAMAADHIRAQYFADDPGKPVTDIDHEVCTDA
jgi:GntR family transcriptional regulator, vanillate catabolism transcriptional regulator